MTFFRERYSRRMVTTVVAVVAFGIVGCGRTDTRLNSDPGPGKPSRADGGDKAMRPDPNNAAPSTDAKASAGTDSTGRPADSSGGTTRAADTAGSAQKAEPKQERPVDK
jgi:hypothetical protein